ncbi:head GIN domain-containing protein [Nakamurella sp.]|uniref:head GIN domain-containing protein n=1 Tax=Nakamurella sp. TaxID=1869182 RepID=UPI0037834136
MKRAMSVAAGLTLLLATAGCGQARDAGPATTAHRTVSGVHAVQLETSGDLTINVGEGESLTIDAGANVIDGLTSDVVDGTLVLGGRSGSWFGGSIRYTLTVTELDRIELAGSGNITGAGVPTGDGMLSLSGSGSATLSGLHLNEVTADISGSGGMTVTGAATTASVTISGSGDFDGSGLTTERAAVEVSGSGQARVDVSGTLTATVSGSGDVVYTGNPTSVQRDRSGSGDIVAG